MSSRLEKNKIIVGGGACDSGSEGYNRVHRFACVGGGSRFPPVCAPACSTSSGRTMRRLNLSSRGDLTACAAERAAYGRRPDDAVAGEADEIGWVNFMSVDSSGVSFYTEDGCAPANLWTFAVRKGFNTFFHRLRDRPAKCAPVAL